MFKTHLKLNTMHVVLGTLILSSSTFASASATTVDALGAVNAETVILRAQVARENARNALLKAQRAVRDSNREDMARAPANVLPQVRRITVVNGVHEAMLIYPDRQIEVREGDTLAGGYVVQRILPQAWQVNLKNKAGRLVQISASDTAHTPFVPLTRQPSASFDRPPTQAPSAASPPPGPFTLPEERSP